MHDQAALDAQTLDEQDDFIALHPDYITDPNGPARYPSDGCSACTFAGRGLWYRDVRGKGKVMDIYVHNGSDGTHIIGQFGEDAYEYVTVSDIGSLSTIITYAGHQPQFGDWMARVLKNVGLYGAIKYTGVKHV